MYFEFSNNDTFNNVLKMHPKFNIFIYSSSVDNNPTWINGKIDEGTHINRGFINAYELNVDRTDKIYPFFYKDSHFSSWKTIDTDYYDSASYGEIQTGSYPLQSSVRFTYYAGSGAGERKYLRALKNSLNHYKVLNNDFEFNDETYLTNSLSLINIPSIIYGSQIKKGSVSLKYYITGTLIAEASDINRDGILIHTTGTEGDTSVGSRIGLVMYNEGFIILTGSDALCSGNLDGYPDGADNARWRYFGQETANSSSYMLSFQGTTKVPVNTWFAHVPKIYLNHSNNPTWIRYGENSYSTSTSSYTFSEDENMEIKNITSSSYVDTSGSFKKTTYVSKVVLYDNEKNPLAIAKLANPIKKTEEQDYTIKLKLDM